MLKQIIEDATAELTQRIVEAIQTIPLNELAALPETRRQPSVRATTRAWPECAEPGCTANAWARGKGFCGYHYKEHLRRASGSPNNSPSQHPERGGDV